jgi:predicted nucleic acid-binding protein
VSGFLVDTNVLSEFSRRGEPDPRVKSWVKAAAPGSLYASVLTLAEIRRGIEILPLSKRRTQLEHWLENELLESFDTNVLPVTKAIADRWAVLSAGAQKRGTPLSIIDGLIAATALEHELTLVTRNARDFAGLLVIVLDPWQA